MSRKRFAALSGKPGTSAHNFASKMWLQMTRSESVFFRKYLGWCPNAPGLRPQQREMKGIEEETVVSRGAPSGGGVTGWIGRNGQAAVAITTGLCLIALAAVLKNILLVPAEILNRIMVLYISIYCGYLVSFTPVKGQACPNMPERWPLFWCAVSVLMTLAIIAVYSL